MSKYVVPEEAVNSIQRKLGSNSVETLRMLIGMFIEWVSENPIVPTDKQAEELLMSQLFTPLSKRMSPTLDAVRGVAIEWQKRMFLNLQPELPEEVKELFPCEGSAYTHENMKDRIIAAYELGQKNRE